MPYFKGSAPPSQGKKRLPLAIFVVFILLYTGIAVLIGTKEKQHFQNLLFQRKAVGEDFGKVSPPK